MFVVRHNPESAGSWQQEVAELIVQAGQTAFPQLLAAALRRLVRCDSVRVTLYRTGETPVLLYPDYEKARAATALRSAHPDYTQDPVYDAVRRGDASGVQLLSELASDISEQVCSFRRFYPTLSPSQTLLVITYPQPDVALVAVIGRRPASGGVSRAERQGLEAIYPILEALVKQYWQTHYEYLMNGCRPRGALTHALETFASDLLTAREQEIIRLVLQGFSTEEIAAHLHITVGTVKVHRRNVHTKLDTSSHSQLFGRFLGHLATLTPI